MVDLRVVPTHRNGSACSRISIAVTASIRVLAELARGRVDVLHLHVSKRGSIVRKGALTLLARPFRVPVVLHCHGGLFESDYRRMPRVFQRIVSVVFRQAQSVVVLSSAWRTVYERLVGIPAEKLVVLGNAVELPAAVPTREHPPLGVVFLGRLGPQKGAWDVVCAVAQLPPAVRARIRVVMAGDGDVAGTRSLVRRLQVDDVLEVQDWLDREERDDLLARSSVLVLPSYNEGLPMAMLEAMAWGLVPVVSPVGGIPEVVTDGVNGLLVDAGDVPLLAGAIRRLVEEPGLVRRLSAAARTSVEERDIDLYASRIHAIWRSAHDGRRAAGALGDPDRR
jgi:glycosyltransferase involved in cell wall biosynthesis